MGAAGQTGRLVVDELVALGHEVRGMVRSAEQFDAVTTAGAEPVQGDLLGDYAQALAGVDAVVFCAGAPLGGDPEVIDRDACVAAQASAQAAGVKRWVQLSSLMADRPEQGPPFLLKFLQAKGASDDALSDSALDWTVVRPGGLQDAPATGLVSVGEGLPSGGLPRADVAAVLAATVAAENTIGKAFDLLGGETPVAAAVASV
jgi:uncharacterized protein YbjT (DUF2867 family)